MLVRALVGALEDADRRGVVGVPDRRADEESVELRLGKPVRTCLFDRVLRRDDHERMPHRVRLAVDRDLPLLHDLEQRGLGLRAGAVDLVGEHDVGEDGAGMEFEETAALVVDGDAGDVAREDVGRELHPVARACDRLGHGAGERGLARAGHVVEQQVPLAQERGECKANHPVLAEQHLFDRPDESVEGCRERRGFFGGHRHVRS